MDTAHLVHMANQIEAFFRSENARETAVQSIASHLRRFWDPRMRKALIAHVDAGGEGLSELARDAVQLLRG